MKATWSLAILLCVSASQFTRAQQPKLNSLFPAGGQRGSSFTTRVRGENLEGAHGVRFDCSSLEAEVESVERIILDGKKMYGAKDKPSTPGHRVELSVHISDTSVIGFHVLRLVTPRGLSGPLLFHVHAERSIEEVARSKGTPDGAQRIEFPAVIHGTTGKPGELDHYEFDVLGGQKLRFELLTGSGLHAAAPNSNLEPDLVLLDPSGSWFDPRRASRIEVDDASNFFKAKVLAFLPRFSHRFEKKGRYLARVATLGGNGGPDLTYLLRIVKATQGELNATWSPFALAHADESWNERSFSRKLAPDWLRRLGARTVGAASVTTDLLIPVAESEPNESPDRALAITVPTVVEGSISRPGDVDSFKFHVKADAKLVFEIETPGLAPPHFSPRVTVLGAGGREVLDNIHRFTGGDGDDWIKTIQPKVSYTFETAGEYCLQIRDLPSRRAGAEFTYRVLLRPQVPHVGAVAVRHGRNQDLDLVNLLPGETVKLNIVTELEEAFAGEIALSLENLPPGVQALPASSTQVEKFLSGRTQRRGDVYPERFFPQRRVTTLMLIAEADAPPTPALHVLRLRARPIVGGKPGATFLSQNLPFVLARGPVEETAKK